MILGMGAKREQAYVRICRNGAFLFILLLCLCVNLWGACNTEIYTRTQTGANYCAITTSTQNICYPVKAVTTFDGSCNCKTSGNPIPTQNFLISVEQCATSNEFIASFTCEKTGCGRADNSNSRGYLSYQCTTIRCSSQAEADSVACEKNPSLPNCRNACSDYKDECESHGGSWQGSVTSDTTCASTCDLCGTPESQAMREYVYNSCCEGGLTPQYSCGFPGSPSSISGMIYSDVLSMGCNTSNWETQKICDAFYEESSSSQNSSSSAIQSSSSVSEYCLLFPTDLACICADNPNHPDCAYLSSNSSSDSQEPGSSGGGGDTSSDSGGGGTPSSSGSGGVLGDDWEYDYRDSLHRIINATTRTATNTQAIKENTNGIWNLLKNAKCLFTDCTDYDQLKISLDSNIVIPDGDTAGVIGSMSPLDSNMMEMLDVAANGDINGIGPESLQTALLDFGDKVGGLYGDSSGIKNDMDQFGQTIQNHFPTAQWSYTGACPAALNKTISFNLPLVGNVDSGKKLGGYICEPLPTLGVTLGSTVRDIVRLVVTIFMAFGIFKAATGLKHE